MECICIPTTLPVNLAEVGAAGIDLPQVNLAPDAAVAHTLQAEVVAAVRTSDLDTPPDHTTGSSRSPSAFPSSSSARNSSSSPSAAGMRTQKPDPAPMRSGRDGGAEADETTRALEALRAELRAVKIPLNNAPAAPRPQASLVPPWLALILVALLSFLFYKNFN